MQIKAASAPPYRFRLTLFAIGCLGLGVWFLHDGWVAYPKDREIHRAFQALKKEGLEGDALLDRWKQIAGPKGWPDGTFGEPGKDRSNFDIQFNLIAGAALELIGIWFGVGAWLHARRWIALDGDNLTTSWGLTIPLEAILTLDKSRWAEKGTALVIADAERGGKCVVLDDWKYDRDATTKIVETIQRRLRPEQIVGDRPAAIG